MTYYTKYIKYKIKYMNLKRQLGGDLRRQSGEKQLIPIGDFSLKDIDISIKEEPYIKYCKNF